MSNTQNPFPPQTARWWFAEYLPEPYRGQAIANADKTKKNKVYPYLCEAIDSFSWFEPENPQGFDYWDAVFHDASRGEFSTPNTHEPTAEQIKSATASFAGVETDAYMDEVRGRDILNTYHIKTTQFEATVICADTQGAMDLLFNFMINSCAFEFRFDRSNVVEGWMTPEGAKAGVLEFKKL